jgi:ABC-type branched-subunit amino acid transport system ATPase component
MDQKHTSQNTDARNEGEGNKTAARQYNEAQRRFVQSGKVEEKAREAEKSLKTGEKRELERAEAVGKRHKVAEDPEITRKY